MYSTILDETRRPPATARTHQQPPAPRFARPDRAAPAAVSTDTRTPAGREAVLALPAEAQWVPVARRCVAAVLTQWRFPSATRESAELIVGELAANAAEHGRHDMTVRLSLHAGALWISVTDSGAQVRSWPPRDTDPDEHGRGLSIVEVLAQEMRVSQSLLGRRVDVVLRTTAAEG
ncbi:ATP-binding protein [Streptomyces puniciscabiei]|uniref:ATP-binding protein n=1 Tax=Streptomyces puniciscabiei TaxID=164348 RepID=UPI00331FEBB3